MRHDYLMTHIIDDRDKSHESSHTSVTMCRESCRLRCLIDDRDIKDEPSKYKDTRDMRQDA